MSYAGMSATTGREISDLDHLRQSIRDILTTRIGTRVMRRDYGSELPALIDQPIHGPTRMRVMAATVAAIARWEPRVRIDRIDIEVGTGGDVGRLVVELQGTRIDGARREAVKLEVPVT